MSEPPRRAATRAHVQTFALQPGLYVVRHMGLRPSVAPAEGPAPFAAVFCPAPGSLQIFGDGTSDIAYLRQPGDATVLRAGARGATAFVTEITRGASAEGAIIVGVTRLDSPALVVAQRGPFSILAHVQRLGDRVFAGDDWAGGRDDTGLMEGFQINWSRRPDGLELEAAAIAGDEPPAWRPSGSFVGSRGKSQPLAGFALRLAGPAAAGWTLAYHGRFAGGHEVGPLASGPCRGPTGAEKLVALKIVLTRIGAEPERAPPPPRQQQPPREKRPRPRGRTGVARGR